MKSRRQQKITEAVAHMAGDYFARELGIRALITVTRAELSPDLKKVTVFFSVLPETKEEEVLQFTKRERSAFRAYITEHSFIHPTPVVDFVIDFGEKNRQRMDELTRKKSP